VDNETRFYRLKGQTRFEIKSFESRLNQLEAEQYPSDVADALIRCIRINLQKHSTNINQIENDFTYDEIGAITRLQSARNIIIYNLSPYITLIEGARTCTVPWSIVPLFEKISQSLYEGNKRILITCTDSPTYRISWSENNNNCLCKFCILEIPSLLKLDALNHLNMAHEIFHPVVDDFISKNKNDFLVKIRDSISKSSLMKDKKVKLHEAVELARRIWEGALKEIMCDMGCVAIFGPAGFFSLGDTAVTMDLDELPMPDSFHPPWRFRIRVLLKYPFKYGEKATNLNLFYKELNKSMATKKLSTILKNEFEKFNDISLIDDDLIKINNLVVYKLTYNEIENIVNSAWDYISKLSKKSNILWENSISQITPLIQLLRIPAPPGEIISQNDENIATPCPSAIANAAWLFQFDGRQLIYEKKPIVKLDYRTFSKLLLKAFENVELKLHHDESKQSGSC